MHHENTRRGPLAGSVAILLCASWAVHADTTWRNTASAWSTAGNWTNGIPASNSAAVLPAAGSRINPSVSGSVSALGLSINASSGTYDIAGSGTISLYSGGLSMLGSGTNTISPVTLFATNATYSQANGCLGQLRGIGIQNSGSILINNSGTIVLGTGVFNATAQATDPGSIIHCKGSGQTLFASVSTGATAYTGDVLVDTPLTTKTQGLVTILDPSALGQRSGGDSADVRLKSGIFSDPVSQQFDPTTQQPAPFTGDITFEGGHLCQSQNLLYSQTLQVRGDAGYSGIVNVTSAGGVVDMEDLYPNELFGIGADNTSVNFNGKLTGSGLLTLIGDTSLPSVGKLKLNNTSTTTPSDFNGGIYASAATAIRPKGIAGGSNPLGSGFVVLAGGTLELDHPGSSGNTISTFASNQIQLYGGGAGNINGTLSIGDSTGVGSGKTVQMAMLVFLSNGDPNQTLTVQNISGASGYKVQFLSGISVAGNATVTTGANVANIISTGPLTGSGMFTKSGANQLDLDGGAGGFTGALIVDSGTLALNATTRLNDFTVYNGAVAKVGQNGRRLARVQLLTLDTGAELDLQDNDLITATTSASQIRGQLIAGRNGGVWNGKGLRSSSATAAASTSRVTALGYATGAQLQASTFRGETISASDVVVRYTLTGDANLDGRVNTIDFNRLAGSFGYALEWFNGDFNYDGTSNSLDFGMLLSNYGATVPSSNYLAQPTGASLPEDLVAPFAGPIDVVRPRPIEADLARIAGDQLQALRSIRSAGLSTTVVPEPAALAILWPCMLALRTRRLRSN